MDSRSCWKGIYWSEYSSCQCQAHNDHEKEKINEKHMEKQRQKVKSMTKYTFYIFIYFSLHLFIYSFLLLFLFFNLNFGSPACDSIVVPARHIMWRRSFNVERNWSWVLCCAYAWLVLPATRSELSSARLQLHQPVITQRQMATPCSWSRGERPFPTVAERCQVKCKVQTLCK